jgi:hypothetical protein
MVTAAKEVARITQEMVSHRQTMAHLLVIWGWDHLGKNWKAMDWIESIYIHIQLV